MNQIIINEENIYKISHGIFVKNKLFKENNLPNILEENNWICLNRYTGKGQGDAFMNQLKIGDYVLVSYGGDRILYLAKVTSDYSSLDSSIDSLVDNSGDWIYREVEPIYLPIDSSLDDLKGDRRIFMPSGNSTFYEMPKSELDYLNNNLFESKLEVSFLLSTQTNKTQNIPKTLTKSDIINLQIPLNQILFGPPGTGKTFNSIKEAIKIASPDFNINQAWEFIKAEYDRLIHEKQVVFTTFHQSMSYEDFVEGIKPLEPTEEGGNVIYKVVEGLFKKICKRANPVLGNLESIIEAFKKEISEDDINKKPVTIKASGTTFDVTYRGTSVFYVRPHASTKENAWYPVNITHIEKVFSTDSYDGVYNQTYVREIIQYLIQNKGLQKGNKAAISKNYVLIIDEINRGNVSSIFGELITLLEENKRQGKKESLEIMLPYSQEIFSVPENLYIIGTMNTADRSVEALDTALRRRFSFKEMPPKPSVIREQENKGILTLDNKVIDLATVLETINKRIAVLLDQDHLIGHSYFLNIDTPEQLKATFETNIIPLLQEYFYGDYGKIALVLGAGFCAEEAVHNIDKLFAVVTNYDTSAYQEKRNYQLLMNKDGFNLRNAIDLLLNEAKKDTLTTNPE